MIYPKRLVTGSTPPPVEPVIDLLPNPAGVPWTVQGAPWRPILNSGSVGWNFTQDGPGNNSAGSSGDAANYLSITGPCVFQSRIKSPNWPIPLPPPLDHIFMLLGLSLVDISSATPIVTLMIRAAQNASAGNSLLGGLDPSSLLPVPLDEWVTTVVLDTEARLYAPDGSIVASAPLSSPPNWPGLAVEMSYHCTSLVHNVPSGLGSTPPPLVLEYEIRYRAADIVLPPGLPSGLQALTGWPL